MRGSDGFRVSLHGVLCKKNRVEILILKMIMINDELRQEIIVSKVNERAIGVTVFHAQPQVPKRRLYRYNVDDSPKLNLADAEIRDCNLGGVFQMNEAQ